MTIGSGYDCNHQQEKCNFSARGLVETDHESFHRNILWDIPATYTPEKTFLTLELSLPKFWYKHNIHLLYDFNKALNCLKKLLEKRLHCRFPNTVNWQVWRLDVCYSWRLPSQQLAQQLLDSLKRIKYPRKIPIIFETTIIFTGATYTFKFYLKHPEFRKNDMKALIKDKVPLELVNEFESKALGVIRCEATLRRKYLTREGIETVSDVMNPSIEFEPDEEFKLLNAHMLEDKDMLRDALRVILFETIEQRNWTPEQAYSICNSDDSSSVKDGEVLTASCQEVEINGREIEYNGGGVIVHKKDTPVTILQFFLNKYLGENRGMSSADQVKAKLLEKYKPSKAARLLGFWLHVQKFDSADAKSLYGKTLFYDAKSDLKAAGVSLVDTPTLVLVDKHFLQTFNFDIPSQYVTNRVDDYRDSASILNLPDANTES